MTQNLIKWFVVFSTGVLLMISLWFWGNYLLIKINPYTNICERAYPTSESKRIHASSYRDCVEKADKLYRRTTNWLLTNGVKFALLTIGAGFIFYIIIRTKPVS